MKEGFVIGGGPSVTPEQLAAVKEWRTAAEDRVVMVVNKGFKEIPWADYIFSRDTRFLHQYKEDLEKSPVQVVVGNTTFTPEWVLVKNTSSYLSGTAAIEALALMGCLTIYLIGADGHHRGGAHWFENYTDLPNAPNYNKFDEYYKHALQVVEGIEVYNLSPGTAIEAVPIKNIDEILETV